jgi:hypothetical protein
VWATSLAEIDDHVDRLLDEKSTIWPAGHMASIRERFDTKRKEWKAELAEAQRVNKQRQDETGLTAVQRAEAAASATESESWENLLNSPPTSLAGALAFTRYVLKSLREDTHQERTKEPNEGALRALVTMETSLAGVAGV